MSEHVVKIWEFHNAPRYLQDLSMNGGDEDFVILFPNKRLSENLGFERMVDSMTVSGCDWYLLDSGEYVAILSHS